jgi:DNA primase catalytic subunit
VDEHARKLSSQARNAIVEYLSIVKVCLFYYYLFQATKIINKFIKGGDSVAKKVNLSYIMHPSLRFYFYK